MNKKDYKALLGGKKMPKVIIVEDINSKRMEIKAKGYVTANEAGTYCGVSKCKGREIYKEIEKELKSEGVRVNSCGIHRIMNIKSLVMKKKKL